ncbi:MAG: capsule assembly Wzi family protein, partial [Steroidobacteraceae bacterium]|nr:capsule assembly Wzi family protein [Steroidobacteraceae bacterium]
RGFQGAGYRVAAGTDADPIRGFADSPREEGEATLGASWLSDNFAVKLRATYALDPDDNREYRADGSYVGLNVGNFMLSAGYMDRWWGPGWDGSLILSNNARPIPSLALERNYSDAFKIPVLSLLGPWRASIAVGEAEERDVAVPKVRFFAARVNLRPRPWLEVGLSRTAQWCGGGRPCGWKTFTDMLLGRDNQVDGEAMSPEQPGNQLAGYDVRVRSPWTAIPVAVYTQWIGEDEAGGLPSKFLGLAGMEAWGSSAWGGWRLRAEYADTTCNFSRETPQFDCAYRSQIYTQGYQHRGRTIGHSLDNDSQLYSLGATLVRPSGANWSVIYRTAEINRDGGQHTISTIPLEHDNVELRHSRDAAGGRLSAGVSFEKRSAMTDSGSDLRGFLIWQQGF